MTLKLCESHKRASVARQTHTAYWRQIVTLPSLGTVLDHHVTPKLKRTLHRIVPADYCDCFVQVVCVQRCGSDRAADHVTECARSPWVETSWEVDHAKEPDSREPFFKFGETCWSCGGKALSGTGIVHGDGESVLAFKQTLKRSSFAPLLSWRPSSSVLVVWVFFSSCSELDPQMWFFNQVFPVLMRISPLHLINIVRTR